MAARVLLGQRAPAQLVAGLVAGSFALYPSVAHAEAPSGLRLPPKKSIYDDYDETPSAPKTSAPALPSPEQSYGDARPVIRRGPTATDLLAAQIRRARLFLHAQAATVEDGVNSALGRALDLEQSFTATVASLAPPRESGERVMPGLVYVLVAAMAGSIVARRRNVLLRAATPAVFGVATGWAVLPFTMRNVGDLAWRYEERVPAVANAHVRTREVLEKSVVMSKVHYQLGVQFVEDKVTATRESLEGWVRKGK
ncbi:hypothetical protein RB597_004541 [Gaeumannomyces tritici]